MDELGLKSDLHVTCVGLSLIVVSVDAISSLVMYFKYCLYSNYLGFKKIANFLTKICCKKLKCITKTHCLSRVYTISYLESLRTFKWIFWVSVPKPSVLAR